MLSVNSNDIEGSVRQAVMLENAAVKYQSS
jgi:hypothetical protein